MTKLTPGYLEIFKPPDIKFRMKKRIITDTLPSNEKLNSRYLDLEALAEVEDHLVALSSISVFELIITPDIKNENVFGSLEQLRLA